MDKSELRKIVKKVKHDNQIFKQKSKLASLSNEIPTSLVGRGKQTKQLVRYLMSYEEGMVVPLVSVFGRSGSGKSSLVKFVCSNISDIEYCYVNFRKARTIFGCANLILGAMGHEPIQSAKGMNKAIDTIHDAIKQKMSESEKKLYVLILDEFDVIMYDRRANPSDFVYRLIEMQSDLVEKNIPTTMISISNNVIGDYEFDDRVRSRIGSSEIFFTPFSKVEILDILVKRAEEAFEEKIDGRVLEDIADRCSDEHGDIRRAVELLRVSAELASIKKMPISERFVEIAALKLEKDRLEETMETLSAKSKWVCFSLAALSHTTGKEWHSTMHIFEYYRKMLPPGSTLISYRRVSDLLVDLQNTGVVSSSTTSEGRNGYSSKYRLNMNPETVGKMIDEERWQIELRRMKRLEEEEIVKKYIFGKKSLF